MLETSLGGPVRSRQKRGGAHDQREQHRSEGAACAEAQRLVCGTKSSLCDGGDDGGGARLGRQRAVCHTNELNPGYWGPRKGQKPGSGVTLREGRDGQSVQTVGSWHDCPGEAGGSEPVWWLFSRSVMPDSVTAWTAACQAPLSMGLSRPEY